MVFFVWTNDGGPLQYVGLVIFLLQVAPNILQIVPSSWLKKESAALLAGICAGIVATALYKITQPNNTNHRQQQWRQHFDSLQARLVLLGQDFQQRLQQRTGYTWTTGQVMAFSSLIAGTSVLLLLLLYSQRMLSHLYQAITLVSIATTLLRQRDHANYDGEEQQRRREERRRAAKRQALDALLQRLPTEPFVTNEALDDSQQVSITQLKQMLLVRKTTMDELDSILDRQNLVDLVKKKRQYSDTCCICFEAYTTDNKLRVLPNCGHELHDTCLEQWVNTFCTNLSKLRQDPTCPLCKEVLQ